MVVGFCGMLLFLFVPESFWDRTPVPKNRKVSKAASRFSLFSLSRASKHKKSVGGTLDGAASERTLTPSSTVGNTSRRPTGGHRQITPRPLHVGFAPDDHDEEETKSSEPALPPDTLPVATPSEAAMNSSHGRQSGIYDKFSTSFVLTMSSF